MEQVITACSEMDSSLVYNLVTSILEECKQVTLNPDISTIIRLIDRVLGRVPHGYGETRGVPKMGNTGTGMGTVGDFGTPRHTAYSYRGVAGINGFIVAFNIFIISIF